MCIHDSGGGAGGVVEWCLGPHKKLPKGKRSIWKYFWQVEAIQKTTFEANEINIDEIQSKIPY